MTQEAALPAQQPSFASSGQLKDSQAGINPEQALPSTSKPQGLAHKVKDCTSRACAGVLDAFKKYSSAEKHRGPSASGGAAFTAASLGDSKETDQRAQTGQQSSADDGQANDSAGPGSSGSDRSGYLNDFLSVQPSTSGQECPPESGEIGRSTWTFLHSMAAYYPEQPTQEQQFLMRCMLMGLSQFYPCEICSEHLRDYMQRQPPKVSSNADLSQWLCGVHNEVNGILGKPSFDCSKVFERWRDGPADGSCD